MVDSLPLYREIDDNEAKERAETEEKADHVRNEERKAAYLKLLEEISHIISVAPS